MLKQQASGGDVNLPAKSNSKSKRSKSNNKNY